MNNVMFVNEDEKLLVTENDNHIMVRRNKDLMTIDSLLILDEKIEAIGARNFLF